MMENDELKLKPYDRLKSILSDSDNILTDKASDKIDQILDIKRNNTIFDVVKNTFLKIDRIIFRK